MSSWAKESRLATGWVWAKFLKSFVEVFWFFLTGSGILMVWLNKSMSTHGDSWRKLTLLTLWNEGLFWVIFFDIAMVFV